MICCLVIKADALICFREEPFPLYRVSYIYYTVISVLVCCTVALVVSYLTGPNDPSKMNKNLLCPYIHRFIEFEEKPEADKKAQEGVVLKSYSQDGGVFTVT